MYALEGYIQGNTIIANESVNLFEGCKVIITILDRKAQSSNTLQRNAENDRRRKAALELAGLWKSHDDADEDAETFVRRIREGRRFDI